MNLRNKAFLDTLIANLFKEKSEIGLHEIAERANFDVAIPADRRAIQRALKRLIEQGIVHTKGNARARVYVLNDQSIEEAQTPKEHTDFFKDIPLSKESLNLLPYFEKPVRARKPVGYHFDFLKNYQPNHTAYLSASLRKTLHQSGKAESVTRPAGTYARNILNRLLIDLAWNSSRLEGNTYSLLETKRLIELGESAKDKNATETQMIINHKEAIEYIVESVDEPRISSHEVYSIHALLSENLLGDESASGRLRKIAVGISGTTYIPLDNPHLLKEYFDIFIEKLNLINDPFEQSFFSLVHLSYLQAFEDVNKRTSRLVANIPLIKDNLKPLSFIDVDQKDYMMALLGIYEKNDVSLMRDLYLWAYKISSQRYSALQQSMGEPNLFKLKYRNEIQNIVRTVILENIPAQNIVLTIKDLIKNLNLPERDSNQLFQIIETEIMNLHDGNIARFKIRPNEFQRWKGTN